MKRYLCLIAFFSLILSLTTVLLAVEGAKGFNSGFAKVANPPEKLDRVEDEMIVKMKSNPTHRLYTTEATLNTASLRDILKVDFKAVRQVYRGKGNKSQRLSGQLKSYQQFKQNNRDENTLVLKVEKSKWKEIYQGLKKNTAVEYVIPNYLVKTYAVPNDSYYGDLWGLQTIEFEDILGSEKFDREVIIAVVDTGLDLTHADIAGNYFANTEEIAGNGIDDDANGFVDDVNGWSFIEGNGGMKDDNGHGTHVSGTVAAVNNNSTGISGIVENGKILPVRVLNASGSGPLSAIIAGIDYAVLMGAEVINMSLGVELDTTDSDTRMFLGEQNERFSIISENQKIVVVVAAGNDHDNNIHNFWPAGAENVITVGALERLENGDFARAEFSNFGKGIDLWAPGVDILSLKSVDSTWQETYPGYAKANGTSMASPHVAGGAALVKSAFPDLTGSQVMRVLKQTTAPYNAIMLEKGVLNLPNIEAVEQPLTSIAINLENDYYYIDNGYEGSFDIHGIISSAFAGTYTITLEKDGSVYSSTSGSFQADESEQQVLGSFSFPSPAVNGLSEYNLIITAENSEGIGKVQNVPVMINVDNSFADNYKANHPYFGDHYSSYPGPQNVPYSNAIDLDGDGRNELVVIRSSSENSSLHSQIFVYDFEGNLREGFPYNFNTPSPLNSLDTKLFYKDFNNDGKLEIIALFMQKTSDGNDTNNLEFLVIDTGGQKNITRSFVKTIHETNLQYLYNHLLLYTDYNNDGEEDIVVFQAVYTSTTLFSFSHLQANVYDTTGTELLNKSYHVEELASRFRYLLDAFPITNNDSGHTKNFALFSSSALGINPEQVTLFNSNLDVIDTEPTASTKGDYKTFDLDKDGYTDLGFISHDRSKTYWQLLVYKNNLQEVQTINLPSHSYFNADFQFFVGNVLGDEQNEIVLVNSKIWIPLDHDYNTDSRRYFVLDRNGSVISNHRIPGLERLFSLVNVDEDEYDELIFSPGFYYDKLAIVNADFTPVKEVQLTSAISGINQMPAIWTRSFPFIAKLEENDTYHLFFSNRKMNIIDLGISESSKIRWFNGWGGVNNDLGMNPGTSEGDLQVNFSASFPLSELNGSALTASGDTTATSPSFNSSNGFVTFEDLPFGPYTLRLEEDNFYYNYNANQEIEFSESGQQVELEIIRTVKKNKAYIGVTIRADAAFDRIDDISRILHIKNLATGVVYKIDIHPNSINDDMVVYRNSLWNLPTDTDFEISLEAVKNNFRYWIATTVLQTKTDDKSNELTVDLQQESLFKEMKVFLTAAFPLVELNGSYISATGEVTANSTNFDGGIGFVNFEDLPLGNYSLQLEYNNFWYDYNASKSVEFTESGQQFALGVTRAVKPDRAYIFFTLQADASFDRIEEIPYILYLKNLESGQIIKTTLYVDSVGDEFVFYRHNIYNVAPGTGFQYSLEVEHNGYRYWMDPVNLTTRTDDIHNEVSGILQREPL